MKLQSFAESLAFKIGKEEDLSYIESLKFDILGYRASILNDIPFQGLHTKYADNLKNFIITKEKSILEEVVEKIKIPVPLISKKGNNIALEAFNRIGTGLSPIPIIDLQDLQVFSSRRHTNKSPFIVYDGEYLIASKFKFSSLDGFFIRGVFINPLEILELHRSGVCEVKSPCIVEDDIDIDDSLYQKIVIFMYKQLGLENNINEIITSNNEA